MDPGQLPMEVARYWCPLLFLSFLCHKAPCYRCRRDSQDGPDCPNKSTLATTDTKWLVDGVDREVLRRREEDVIQEVGSMRKHGL